MVVYELCFKEGAIIVSFLIWWKDFHVLHIQKYSHPC